MKKKNILISGGKGYLGNVISESLEKAGFNIINERIDLTNEDVVREYAKKIKDEDLKLWGIIHAASAPLIRKRILDESVHDFQNQFNINVLGGFNLFKYFSPLIMKDGFIIGITSKSIDNSSPHQNSGSYVPAKLALKGFLRVLSIDLLPEKIRVYAVAPAFMPGGLNADMPEKVIDLLVKKSSPEDVCTPEAVASLIFKLALNDELYKSGISITIPDLKVTKL